MATITKTGEIGTLKGTVLATPIKFDYSFDTYDVDTLVSALADNSEIEVSERGGGKRKSTVSAELLSKVNGAMELDAYTAARSVALSENEPREVKIERFVRQAVKIGVTEAAAKMFAEQQFPA